jgi:hypothetical protein
MSATARPRNTRLAMAARQALRPCESEQLTRPRVSVAAARAALRSAGIPPVLAAALRARLHLIPQQEAQR